jgi:hypothetical protein
VFVGDTGDNHGTVVVYCIDLLLMLRSVASCENPAPHSPPPGEQPNSAMATDYIKRYIQRSLRVVSFLSWKCVLQHWSSSVFDVLGMELRACNGYALDFAFPSAQK